MRLSLPVSGVLVQVIPYTSSFQLGLCPATFGPDGTMFDLVVPAVASLAKPSRKLKLELLPGLLDRFVLYADSRIEVRFKVPVSAAKVGESILSAARLTADDLIPTDDDEVLTPVVRRIID